MTSFYLGNSYCLHGKGQLARCALMIQQMTDRTEVNIIIYGMSHIKFNIACPATSYTLFSIAEYHNKLYLLCILPFSEGYSMIAWINELAGLQNRSEKIYQIFNKVCNDPTIREIIE